MSSEYPSPGNLSRLELAAGDLLKRIAVNGNYLFAENIDVSCTQVIQPVYLIQGGPNVAISDFQGKVIKGDISFPLLVDSDGNIDPAAQAILTCATLPFSENALRIDTNHVLSDINITAEDGGTDNNVLIALDTVMVTDLKISVAANNSVMIAASLIGLIDLDSDSTTVSEPTNGMEMRNVSFGDCAISRIQSRMRGTIGLEVNIKNEIKEKPFLIPGLGASSLIQSTARTDQPYALIRSTVKWGGAYDEFTRLGASTEDFMHGGWMVGQNLVIDFGCVLATFTVPTFQVTKQKLASTLYKRHVDFYGQYTPTLTAASTGLFTYKVIE